MTTDTKPVVERVYPPKLVTLLANPVMRRLLRRPGSGPSKSLMLLEFAGRKSGRRFAVPVARQQLDGQTAALTNSAWRHNFRGGHDCVLWVGGTRRDGRGTLVDDTDRVVQAYRAVLAEIGLRNARRAGIRINADRLPTDAELAAAVDRYGLSYVTFTLEP